MPLTQSLGTRGKTGRSAKIKRSGFLHSLTPKRKKSVRIDIIIEKYLKNKSESRKG